MTPIVLQNSALTAHIDPNGAKVQRLTSRLLQRSVLYENAAGGLFPMLPLANRVAGNRFVFQGREITLPHHHADSRFFLHGDGWLWRWDVVKQGDDNCVLQLRSQHDCGFDYVAKIRYQLRDNQFVAALTLTHCGEAPMLYGAGFHPFFPFDKHSQVQFHASGYWPEGDLHLPLGWQGRMPRQADFTCPQYGEDAWLNVGYSGWNGRAQVFNDVMIITILSQAPWLMLFRMQGEPFLCLEPQSHPVNAHNTDGQPGLRVLGAGDVLHFAMTIDVQARE